MFKWRDLELLKGKSESRYLLTTKIKKLNREKGTSPGKHTLDTLQKHVNDTKQDIVAKETAADIKLKTIPSMVPQHIDPDYLRYDKTVAIHKFAHNNLVSQLSNVRADQATASSLRALAYEGLESAKTVGHNPLFTIAATNHNITNIDHTLTHISQYNTFLATQTHNLHIFNRGLINEDNRQKNIDEVSIGIAKASTHKPLISPPLNVTRAKTIPAHELIHTKFFDEISQMQNIEVFDIAIARVLDINAKNALGLRIITYVVKNMFEHGIKVLLAKKALLSETFLFLLKEEINDDAVKLLINLVNQVDPVFGYNEIFSSLTRDSTITYLNMSGMPLTSQSLASLTSALADNMNIKELNLSGCNIPYDGGISLARMFKYNTTIQVLDISNNNIEDIGVFYLVSDLSQNTHLLSLNLSNVGMTDEAAEVIACLLDNNCSLVRINLSYNQLGAQGIEIIKSKIIDNIAIIDFVWPENNDASISTKILQNYTSFEQNLQNLELTQFIAKHDDFFKELFILHQQIISNVCSSIDKAHEQSLLNKMSLICVEESIEDNYNNNYALELIARFENIDLM